MFCLLIFSVVKRPVPTGVLVAEYKGTVVPRSTLYKDMQLEPTLQYICRPPSPFILFPPPPPFSIPNSTSSFGVDARSSGSPARFVRRSCTPNADVRVLWDKTNPRFGVSFFQRIIYFSFDCIKIFAKQQIDENTEVTIPFDVPWRIVHRRVKCTCESKSCEMYIEL